MRIDAHQHFWSYSVNRADYGWIDDAMSVLRADFLPGDIQPLMADIGFSGGVAVQALEPEDRLGPGGAGRGERAITRLVAGLGRQA